MILGTVCHSRNGHGACFPSTCIWPWTVIRDLDLRIRLSAKMIQKKRRTRNRTDTVVCCSHVQGSSSTYRYRPDWVLYPDSGLLKWLIKSRCCWLLSLVSISAVRLWQKPTANPILASGFVYLWPECRRFTVTGLTWLRRKDPVVRIQFSRLFVVWTTRPKIW